LLYLSVDDDWERLKSLQQIQRRPSLGMQYLMAARVGAVRHAIPRAVLAALTVLGALQWPASAPATPSAAEREAVIQPGQETILADMLGQGMTLPDGCAFTGGHVEAEIVAATYRCATGDVRIELRHPSAASPDARRTEQFALTVTAGTPPPALIDALASRIRDHEDGFQWTWQPVVPKEPERSLLPWLGAAGLLLALAAAAWLMRRHARRTSPSGVSRPGHDHHDLGAG
jgi:hypothetical protein